MLTNKQVFFAKIEAEEGVAETINPATDATLILEGGDITPSGDKVGNKRMSATLSKEQHTIGQKSSAFAVPCELRGGGITGSAAGLPDFDVQLRACAMKRTDIEFIALGTVTGTFVRGETVTGGTSSATGVVVGYTGGGLLLEDVVGTFQDAETLTGGTSSASADADADPISGYQYRPTSNAADKPSLTGVYYLDGHKHTMLGGRGTFSVDFPAGEKATITFNLNGRWTTPVQESNPTPTLLETDAPLVEAMGLSVGGHAPLGVTSLALDMANVVSKAKDMNVLTGLRAYNVTDRVPAGSFDPEAEVLGDYNPWAEWENGTLSEMSFQLGAVAGNRIFVCMPKIQKTSVAYGDSEGIVKYNESFELKRDDAGDDELRMVFF